MGVNPVLNDLDKLKARISGLETELSLLKSQKSDLCRTELNAAVFAHLIEEIGDFVIVTDDKGFIQYANKAFILRFGYTRKELYGSNASILLEPGIRDVVSRKILTETLGGSWLGELDNITKYGEVFRVSLRTSEYKSTNGTPFFISISHDIARSHKAEQELLSEREMLQNLMDSMPDTIYFKDTEGRFTRINKAQADVLGVKTPEDARGKSDFDFFDPVHAAEAYKDEQDIIATGNPLVAKPEYIRTGDGTYKWVSASKAPYIDSHGNTTGIMGISRDISAEHEAYKKLAENEALLSGVIDGMSDIIVIRDSNLQTIRINKAAEKYNQERALLKTVPFADNTKNLEITNTCAATVALETGHNQVNEIQDEQSGRFFECRTTPITDSDKNIRIIIEQIRDITAKRKAERALAANQQRFKVLVENLPAGIALIREDSIYINIAAAQIMGLNPEYVQGPDEWFNTIFKDNALNIRSQIKENRKLHPSDNCEINCFRADGTPFTADISVFMGLDGEVWLFSDITEKKKSESELRELYNRFSQITSQLPGMVFQFVQYADKRIGMPYTNEYIRNIFGINEEQVQQNPDLLLKKIVPDDLARFKESFEVSARTLQQWNHEFRIYNHNHEILWLRGTSTPQRNTDGSTLWHGFITDITKNKQVESEINKAHEKLEATLDAIPDLLFDIDDDGIIYNFHAPAKDPLYAGIDIFSGKNVTESFPEMASHQIMKAIGEAAEFGYSTGIQYQITKDHQNYWYELSISKKDNRDENQRYIALVRNITSRKATELQLAHQSKVLEGVAKATTALLVGEDINEAINYAFKIIGNAAKVDRVYLFEYHPNSDAPEELLLSQRFEWCSDGTIPQINNPELQNLPSDFIPRWKKLLASGLAVKGFVRDFPENEREILESQDIISLLVVPVYAGEHLFGFVGFDDCSRGYNWSQSESLILQSLASGIGNAILRKRSEEKLKFSENRFRVMFEESPLGIILSDENGLILNTNKALLRLLSLSGQPDMLASFYDLIPEQFSSLKAIVISELRKTGRSGPIELHLTSPNGKNVPVLMNLVLVRDLDQKPRVWSVIEDVSERKKSESELIKARDEANRANKAKSEFLANMSHEIRTPLNAILGFSELLADQISDPKQHQFVQIINKSGKNLLLIINDILDLSKIEAGRVKIELEPVNPRSILSELDHIFSLATSEKNIKFFVEADPELPQSLLLDETRVRQVLFNLVGNAVKFTHEGTVSLLVKVASKVPDHSIIDLMFEVSDTGIGIPADQHEAIFQAFRQQEGQSTRKFGGTGLGLTITKRFVEMMNGRITVESTPGHGSIFRVMLFDVNVAAASPAKTLSSDLQIAHAFTFNDPLILLVEDIDVNRLVIREMLSRKNIRLIEAVNGKLGLEMAQKHHPDLILMDMQMPVMDGYTVTRILKNDQTLKHIPIVALTASAMKDEAKDIKGLCDGYLQKPVTPGVLMSELNRFLNPNEKDKKTNIYTPPVLTELVSENSVPDELRIGEVQAENLLKELAELKEGMIIDEIIGFSIRLGLLAAENRSSKLRTLANEIKNQAEAFHISKLQKSFSELESLLVKIVQS